MAVTISDEPFETKRLPSNGERRRSSPAWIWFVLGTVLLFFSNGANNVALAAWLSPVLLLHFVRRQSWRIWIPLLVVAETAAAAFQFRGMFPLEGTVYYGSLVIGSLQALIPFAADRWLARRIRGFASTLVFPCTWTSVDYFTSIGPFGSWGATGYSQYGELPLLQILSVTGLWGLTFLIGWLAATLNYLWDEGYGSRHARKAAYISFITIASLILLGGLRLTFFPPRSPTVRIASISKRPVTVLTPQISLDRLLRNQATAEDLTEIHAWASAVNHDLLLRADREAQAGAKIVFWAEGNAMLLKPDEAALVAQGSELAAKDHIYMGMAMAVLNPGQTKLLENKFVIAEPDGAVRWQYYKAHPVPGDEAAMSVTKDAGLRVLETPFARVSAVICFDGDFPQLLRQAGSLRSDIVLDPSNDWRSIDPWHTEMASFRAIEQGINFDRQTSHGRSAAFDYQGRTLAAMDHFYSSDYAMTADLPTRGVRTIYSRFGDWFAWLNIGGSFLLVVAAFRPSGQQGIDG